MLAQIFAFVVNFGVGFFLTPYIVNHVGKEAYGFIGLALNFISYAQLITIALNSMVTRNITISIHSNDLISANKYFTSVFYCNIIFSLVLSVCFLFFIIYLDEIVNIPLGLILDIKLLFSFIFLNFLIGLLSSVYGVSFFVKNRLDLASLRSIISNVIRVSILFFCFTFFIPNVWYIGLASVLTTVYLSYTNYSMTNQLLPYLKIDRRFFDLQKIKDLLKSGIWNTLSKLSGILNIGFDLLLANLFISSSAMGTLALAKTIPSIILSVFGTLAGVYSPNLTIAFASNNLSEIKQQLFSSMKFFGIISSIPLSFLFAFGDIFFKLWIPGENYNLVHVLSIITCFELCFALPQEALWNVFTVTNKVKASSLNLFLMSSLTIICVFIAMNAVEINYRIYFLGGITSFYGIIRLLTFLPIYGARCLGIHWATFYPILIRNFISILILTFLSLIIKKIVNPNSWFALMCLAILTTVLGLVLNLFTILNKKERKFYYNFLKSNLLNFRFK
jgi:O-antigen/teichoic acid export membrane protein